MLIYTRIELAHGNKLYGKTTVYLAAVWKAVGEDGKACRIEDRLRDRVVGGFGRGGGKGRGGIRVQMVEK